MPQRWHRIARYTRLLWDTTLAVHFGEVLDAAVLEDHQIAGTVRVAPLDEPRLIGPAIRGLLFIVEGRREVIDAMALPRLFVVGIAQGGLRGGTNPVFARQSVRLERLKPSVRIRDGIFVDEGRIDLRPM